jgi:hypothetical protein
MAPTQLSDLPQELFDQIVGHYTRGVRITEAWATRAVSSMSS